MPTSTTGRLNNHGFTLIELLVVIVLLGLMTALVAPRLPMDDRTALHQAAGRLGTLTRFLHNEATLAGATIRLDFDQVEGQCQASIQKPDGTFEALSGNEWAYQLPEAVRFGPLQRLGQSRLRTEQTSIRFQPEGWADDTRIWLVTDQQQTAWVLNPLTGVLSVDDTQQP